MTNKEIRDAARKEIGFKEIVIDNNKKLIAFYANNPGRGSDNVTLYLVDKKAERKENCKKQEQEPFLATTRTGSWRGIVNLSNRVLGKLGIRD